MNRKELQHSKLLQKTGNKTCLLPLICLVILFFLVPVASAQEQYKKLSRDAISQIVDGEYDAAIKHFKDYLIKHPRDLESMYGLAVAYSHKNDITTAMAYMETALNEGLQFSRFLAGPFIEQSGPSSNIDFAFVQAQYVF